MSEYLFEHQKPRLVKTVEMICITYLKGDGTENNPVRYVNGYYDFAGTLIFEIDDYDVKSSASSIDNSSEMK